MTWVYIGIGGALGTLARHALNQAIHQRFAGSTFPLGIFAINVIGSVVIGAVAGAIAANRWTPSADARLFVVVGLLGGFTTFSSFSLDTLTLLRAGHIGSACWNVAGQVALSLIGVAAGYRVMAN